MQNLIYNMKFANYRHEWLTVLLAFFIPINQNILSLLIVLLAVNWLFLKKESGGNKVLAFAFIISFYLAHLAGLLWTDNLKFGFFDIQVKLSLLLLPLIFMFSPKLESKNFEKTLSAYVIGCAVAVIIGVIQSSYNFFILDSGYVELYAENLTLSLHIGYFAMYMNFAVIILIYRLYFRTTNLYTYNNLVRVFLILLFSGAVFLSTSRNGLIVLLFVLILAVIYAVISFKKWLSIISLAVISWIILSSVWKDHNNSVLKFHGFDEITTTLKKEKLKKIDRSSSAVRILVWQSALELIKDNPLTGVGTGDIKDELLRVYNEHDYVRLVKRRYNAHNQFLQTAATLGIPAAILFFLMLISPLIFNWKRWHFLGLFLAIIVGVASLTESVLEVQAGVIFYALFASLFAQNIQQDYGTNFINNPLLFRKFRKLE